MNIMPWSPFLSNTAWRVGRGSGRPVHSLLMEAPWPETRPPLLTLHMLCPEHGHPAQRGFRGGSEGVQRGEGEGHTTSLL